MYFALDKGVCYMHKNEMYKKRGVREQRDGTGKGQLFGNGSTVGLDLF